MDVGPIVQQGLNGLAVIFYCRQHQSCRACFFIVCTGIRAKPLKRDSEEEKHSEQKNNAEYSHATNSVETKGALAGFMPVQPKRNGNDRRRHFPRPPLASPARPSPSCGHGHFPSRIMRRISRRFPFLRARAFPRLIHAPQSGDKRPALQPLRSPCITLSIRKGNSRSPSSCLWIAIGNSDGNTRLGVKPIHTPAGNPRLGDSSAVGACRPAAVSARRHVAIFSCSSGVYFMRIPRPLFFYVHLGLFLLFLDMCFLNL